MKKAFRLLFAFLLTAQFVVGQGTEATFLGNWHDASLPVNPWLGAQYNEVWAFAINDREYGVIGSTAGLHFIDVTDPANPQEAFFVAGAASGDFVVHRDFKDFNGYLYAVCDEGGSSTLQIIDLQDLPNSVTQVYSSNEFVVTAHDLYIDHAQERLYLLGASGSTKALDISNPAQPTMIATYPKPGFSLPYVHDAYIENNIGFMNCGNSGLWVVDFTNPASPVVLSTLTSYPGAGYNHSGWMSENGKYYFLCDETHGSPVKAIDVTDLTDLKVISTFSPDVWSGEIVHNAIVRGNLLYLSYYYDGLQVFDISNPANPQRVGYYDTYLGANEEFFAGSWGVNPSLPSGNVLLSDMQSGLFVFEGFPNPANTWVLPSGEAFDACNGDAITFSLSIGDDFSANGVTLSVDASSTAANVTFSQNPAMPGSTVEVTVTGLATGDGTIIINASDDVVTSTASVAVSMLTAPAPATLNEPANSATMVAKKPTFKWNAVPGATSYKLEISTNPTDFSILAYTAGTSATQFTTTVNLAEATTFYWRVVSKNTCGNTLSEVHSFTTEGVSAVGELLDNELLVFPNPARDVLTLSFGQGLSENITVSLGNLAGQQLLTREMGIGDQSLSFSIADFPTGVYVLKLASETEVLTKKIVVQ